MSSIPTEPQARYGGGGRGWFVVGPGVIAGVRQTVRLDGPFTTASQAHERAEELRREAELAARRHSVKVAS